MRDAVQRIFTATTPSKIQQAYNYILHQPWIFGHSVIRETDDPTQKGKKFLCEINIQDPATGERISQEFSIKHEGIEKQGAELAELSSAIVFFPKKLREALDKTTRKLMRTGSEVNKKVENQMETLERCVTRSAKLKEAFVGFENKYGFLQNMNLMVQAAADSKSESDKEAVVVDTQRLLRFLMEGLETNLKELEEIEMLTQVDSGFNSRKRKRLYESLGDAAGQD